MGRLRPLASLCVLVLASCGGHSPGLTPGVYHFTPRAESVSVGPVGTGSARCELYVYQWEPGAHECTVQLNHCSLDASGQTVCMSLADERHIPCGATTNACGQTAQCDCPVGAAAPVPDPPGTVHVTNHATGATFGSGSCTGRASAISGGPSPAPCFLEIHDCTGASCVDRTTMFDCGSRDTECGTPLKCDCAP